ncbi:hypothetical protein CDD83_5595 [Cordyceps sp. RAO-2017]|nr:hypothetical protein CDD83_5595 [Cordyceps sp. RAO-2017]
MAKKLGTGRGCSRKSRWFLLEVTERERNSQGYEETKRERERGTVKVTKRERGRGNSQGYDETRTERDRVKVTKTHAQRERQSWVTKKEGNRDREGGERGESVEDGSCGLGLRLTHTRPHAGRGELPEARAAAGTETASGNGRAEGEPDEGLSRASREGGPLSYSYEQRGQKRKTETGRFPAFSSTRRRALSSILLCGAVRPTAVVRAKSGARWCHPGLPPCAGNACHVM